MLALRVRASARFAPHQASISYQRLLRLLARRGLVKQPWVTPEEFARSVARPELVAAVRELTDLYHAARFGHQPLDTSRFVTLLNHIKSVPENY
jgi:predicted deacylase